MRRPHTRALPPSTTLLQVVAELSPEYPEAGRKALKPFPTSLAWSSDGSTLYSGYTDNLVRVWAVSTL